MPQEKCKIWNSTWLFLKQIVSADILLDLGSTSDTALNTCTKVLTSMVTGYPSLMGDPSTVDLLSRAFSNVLAKGHALEETLKEDIDNALYVLTTSCTKAPWQ